MIKVDPVLPFQPKPLLNPLSAKQLSKVSCTHTPHLVAGRKKRTANSIFPLVNGYAIKAEPVHCLITNEWFCKPFQKFLRSNASLIHDSFLTKETDECIRGDQNLNTSAPGHVTLVVIPDITPYTVAERMRPMASRALLERIEHYLSSRTTPFLRVCVVNPVYQLLGIQAEVEFKAGRARSFYEQELTQACY